MLTKDQKLDWRHPTDGHELVSRALTAPTKVSTFESFLRSPALKQIEMYLDAIHGGPHDPWAVYVNNSCGFHVHVARTGSREVALPLPVLQHLAYILVQYEELISSLHAPTRRDVNIGNDRASGYVASNLMGLHRSYHVCQRQLDLANARQKIFANNMTTERLGKLMNTKIFPFEGGKEWLRANPQDGAEKTRYKFVNFERLYKKSVPTSARTIEFRQHAATMDFIEIAQWVYFLLKLVKAAEGKAVGDLQPATHFGKGKFSKGKKPLKKEPSEQRTFEGKQGEKYKVRCDTIEEEYQNLFDLLELDQEERKYWMNKFREYNPIEVLEIEKDKDGKERIVTGSDECPACWKEDGGVCHCPACRLEDENDDEDEDDCNCPDCRDEREYRRRQAESPVEDHA